MPCENLTYPASPLCGVNLIHCLPLTLVLSSISCIAALKMFWTTDAEIWKECNKNLYENMPMQCTEIFKVVKKIKNKKKMSRKNVDIFLIFAQNIECGYTLEPPRQGGFNEYPQCMFWIKNKKIGILL